MTVTALVGAQYGSEGKGNIAKYFSGDFDVHVRTGGPNAGHTIYHEGMKWKMRSIPCGWVNPDADLVIGAGAVVDLEVLGDELHALDRAGADVLRRLLIDHKATVITHAQREFEGGTEGVAHARIGSTGEGVGIVRMAKIARETVDIEPFNSCLSMEDVGAYRTTDTVGFLWHAITERDQNVLLEGTQGSGLSLTHGHWPFVTSNDTNAAQLAADAGIPPQAVDEVVLVARCHPIRVAGNSGPLHEETTWEEVGRKPETTTVTGKVRRVGRWDDNLFRRAVWLNLPTSVALTFCDYFDDENEAFDLKNHIEKTHGVRVGWMAWGPDEVVPC